MLEFRVMLQEEEKIRTKDSPCGESMPFVYRHGTFLSPTLSEKVIQELLPILQVSPSTGWMKSLLTFLDRKKLATRRAV